MRHGEVQRCPKIRLPLSIRQGFNAEKQFHDIPGLCAENPVVSPVLAADDLGVWFEPDWLRNRARIENDHEESAASTDSRLQPVLGNATCRPHANATTISPRPSAERVASSSSSPAGASALMSRCEAMKLMRRGTEELCPPKPWGDAETETENARKQRLRSRSICRMAPPCEA